MDRDAQLQRLCDVEEIKVLKALYGVSIDSLVSRPDEATPKSLERVFTEDAVVDFGEVGRFVGTAEIANWFGVSLPAMARSMFHSMHSPLIEVDGDRARGRWTVIARMIMRDAPDASEGVHFGRYDDEYVRTADGWRQSRLLFTAETD
ncbi:MAG: uncharacterized protein JWL70_1537 [Acidimicrobiia bacterium]|nr:uncharacterized protein [Acidimicrobiia bacterium]